MFYQSTLAMLCCAFAAVSLAAAEPTDTDWPAWRGPSRDGIASPNQAPLVKWSENEGIQWKVPLPGKGHGSPAIVGHQIFLAVSEPVTQSQSVLCLKRSNGQTLWHTVVHHANAERGHHENSSAASSSPACDGENVFINFLNGGAVYTTSLDREGKVVWQQKICDFVAHQGFASSPVLHEDVVVVSADHQGGGVIAGLDRKTGRVRWTQPRPKLPNYTTPAIIKAANQTQLVVSGCNLVTSLDPVTGRKLWEVKNSTEECVGSAVTDGERVFSGGGYPRNHTVAIRADGSGQVAWENKTRVYVPSMIAKAGYVYAVTDAGMAVCWNSATGSEAWKERLGGDFFASPVMVRDRIYASNVKGETYVFEATADHFKLLAKNQLGDQIYASPVICAGQIYLRVASHADGRRQEFLYSIGK